MDYYWICFATPPIQFTPKKVKGYCAITTFTGMEISPVTRCVFWSFFSQRPSRMKPPSCVHEKIWPHCSWFCPKTLLATSFWDTLFIIFLLFRTKKICICWLCTPFFLNEYKFAKKILKYPMTVDLLALILFLRQKEQWLNSFKCCYLKWTDDPVEQNWLKCLGGSLSRLKNSAQQVLEPDVTSYPVFLSIPNLTWFNFGNHRVAGSPKHQDSQTPVLPNTTIVLWGLPENLWTH